MLRSLRVVSLLAMGAALAAASSAGCSSSAPSQPGRAVAPELTNPSGEPKRMDEGRFAVVWLKGTPYEMGQQQARLLREELKAGLEEVQQTPQLRLMFNMARNSPELVEMAKRSSYPEVLEECQGLVDGAADIGWTMDHCLVLNFGDVMAEFMLRGTPVSEQIVPGCSQILAAGAATTDGRIYHGRILDWAQIDFILNHPVIFVRQPTGGIPHAVIGFPANLSPYQGINAAGLSIASNEAHPRDNTVNDRTGRSHVQMVGQLLAKAHSLDEARAFLQKEDSMSFEIIAVADGNQKKGEVYEMAPAHFGIRPMQDDVVFETNHFVADATKDLDAEPAKDDSLIRFERLGQLVTKEKSGPVFGKVAPEALVGVMRDRINPRTGKESPTEVFDDQSSLATNGALFQVVFDPERRHFWVAAGALPVPSQPFQGFSLTKLLGTGSTDEVAPQTMK